MEGQTNCLIVSVHVVFKIRDGSGGIVTRHQDSCHSCMAQTLEKQPHILCIQRTSSPAQLAYRIPEAALARAPSLPGPVGSRVLGLETRVKR